MAAQAVQLLEEGGDGPGGEPYHSGIPTHDLDGGSTQPYSVQLGMTVREHVAGLSLSAAAHSYRPGFTRSHSTPADGRTAAVSEFVQQAGTERKRHGKEGFHGRSLKEHEVFEEADEEVMLKGGGDDGFYDGMDEKQVLAEIYAKVHQANDHIWKYIQLGSFVLFTALYIAVVYLQANSLLTYEISTSHQALLPPGASGTAPVIFSNGPSEIYDWLNDSFIQTVWADPLCGNGICESPTEHEQFGRFGCLADCGKFANTTRVVLSLSNDFASPQEQAAASWNLCMLLPVGLCW